MDMNGPNNHGSEPEKNLYKAKLLELHAMFKT